MAIRQYPYLAISIVEAVCGSYAFCCFCKALTANRATSITWQFIGMHTMLIYCLHCLDWIAKPLWAMPKTWQTSCMRILVVLVVGMIIYGMKYGLKRKLWMKE